MLDYRTGNQVYIGKYENIFRVIKGEKPKESILGYIVSPGVLRDSFSFTDHWGNMRSQNLDYIAVYKDDNLFYVEIREDQGDLRLPERLREQELILGSEMTLIEIIMLLLGSKDTEIIRWYHENGALGIETLDLDEVCMVCSGFYYSSGPSINIIYQGYLHKITNGFGSRIHKDSYV